MNNLEIFFTEHTPEDSLPKKGSFWAMSVPEQVEVSEINEQAVKDAVQKTFLLHVPNKNQFSHGIYFQVRSQKKDIFRGHINASGQMDSIIRV